MASTEFVDPHLDPETGLLRNKVGARTQVALDAAEGAVSFTRLTQLLERPPQATGDLAELRAIHRHLFGDVFDWAGQIRTVDIRKSVAGAEFFLPVSVIERAAAYSAEELAKDGALVGMGRERFIERLAHHDDAFNYIHPFREGNGRTQRVFWDGVAGRAGWELDWRSVPREVNDRACRLAAEQQDFTELHQMLDQVVGEHPSRPLPASEGRVRGTGEGWARSSRAQRLAFLSRSSAKPPQTPANPCPEPPQGSSQTPLQDPPHEPVPRRRGPRR